MSFPEFSVNRTNSGASPRVSVKGELDLAVADRVQAALADPPEGGETLVLDLGEVSFMDSTGLGLLLRTAARARAEGWPLEIVTSPAVDRVVDVTGARHLLEADAATADRMSSG